LSEYLLKSVILLLHDIQ
jgi:hypothetical protein